ncbi:PT domain-containing protein [Phototrophicus methaneseepsis]|nr:PT domain-containing protein [Phototrophicus methaneseepsis]
MKSLRFILTTLFVVVAMFAVIPSFAQDGDEPIDLEDTFLFEITGVIEISETGDIMIEDVIIAPAGAFNPSMIETLPEGQQVTVTGYLLNDTTLQAISFELVDANGEPIVIPSPTVAPTITLTPDPTLTITPIPTDMATEVPTEEPTEIPTEEPTEVPTEIPTEEPSLDACATLDDDVADGSATEVAPTDTSDDGFILDPCAPVWLNPVGRALAAEFDLDEAVIAEWRAQGLGYGEIARILLIAEQYEDVEAEDVLASLYEYGNWGAVMREYAVSPSSLAPGRVISGHPARRNTDSETELDSELETQNVGPGNSGNAGNNGNGNGRGNNGNNGNGNGNGNGNNGNNGNGNNGNGRGNGNGNGRGNK